MLDLSNITPLPPHLAIKPDSVTYAPYSYDNPLLDYNTYHYGKGGFYDIQRELTESLQGSPFMVIHRNLEIDNCFDIMYETWKKFGGPSPILSWQEVIEMKDPDTSVGYPLNAHNGTFKDLLESETLENIISEFEKAESQILTGVYPPCIWRPFPKTDKYSTKKVTTNKFRVVSTGPLFLLSLCRRYYSVGEENLKTLIPQLFAITDEQSYHDKVVQRMRGGDTFGVDYTLFDKNSTTYLVNRSLKLLHRLIGHSVPQRIHDYIVLSICQPLSLINVIDGNPSLYMMTNTNPSGQYFTTWVNTVTHIAHDALFVKHVLKENIVDYLKDFATLMSVCTGDDGVERFDAGKGSLEIAEGLARFIQDGFDIPCKLDLLNTENGKVLYPPDFLAPYLNSALIQPTPTSYYRIPIHPRRFLPRLTFAIEGELKGPLEDALKDRVRGILSEVRPIRFHEYLNPGLPTNSVVHSIIGVAKTLGVQEHTYRDPENVLFSVRDKT